jgi:serine/threonine protein kinase
MSATEKFEHYEVLKNPDGSLFELGRGAMGITYKALDTDLECFVALKIINPTTIANKDAEQRFFREARIAAQLRHPNIASVFRLGKTDEGAHYYAMEFCEGQTIQQLVEQSGPIECRRALQFTLQVTKALIVAEERHLVHRDLKPSNLIVTQRSDEGEVIKVIDFGLAKTTTSEGTMWSSMGTLGFIGTAHFASPEQIEDKPVDTRSDIYSLGSTLWFMLLGKPPFEGSLARIMSQHLTATPDYSRLHGVPEKVVALIRRMMEKSAEDRPQSALELRREIVEYLGNGCIQTAELRDQPDASKRAVPIPEPPPLPEIIAATPPPPSEPPPEEKWSPSLHELLRVRGVLSPVETLCIGEHLAAKLGEDPESAEGVLRIQDVTIHFHDLPNADQARARLHELVTAWPAFDLVTTSDEAFVTMASTDPSLMSTIVPGAILTGDKVQQLARIIYELLGGVAGPRYVPVARLGEAGNETLQRAIELGLSCYPTSRGLVEKLRETTADAPAPPSISAHIHPTIPASPSATTPPSPESVAIPETQTKVPMEHPEVPPPLPAGPQAKPFSSPASKKSGQSPLLRITLTIVFGVVGLVAMFNGVKTIHSGLSKNQSPARDETPPSSQAPAPSVTAPSVTTPSPSTPTAPAAAPIQFAIFDDLGVGQVSESVQVFVDDQTEPAGSIYLNPAQPHGSAVMNLPSPGHHTFVVKTESRVIDLNRGVKKIEATGRWDIDFRGGEKYDLSATPQDNGDSYQLEVKLRN